MSYLAQRSAVQYIASIRPKVYLYGGYVGYDNFGDIIQLKSVLYFYRQHTILEPVILLHKTPHLTRDRISKLGRWFETSNLIFIGDPDSDLKTTLTQVKEFGGESLFHIYGGGFLNSYWGQEIINNIQSFLTTAQPREYLFSGQQLDRSVIPRLRLLFSYKSPSLFGVRDKQSYELAGKRLQQVALYFSFDDACDLFLLMIRRDRRKNLFKIRKKHRLLIHINTSDYSSKNIKRVAEYLVRLGQSRDDMKPIVIQAYQDIRPDLKDSGESILELNDRFPYANYEVLNLAAVTLSFSPESPSTYFMEPLLEVNFALVSSYHVALFMRLLKVPTFLMNENEFYDQKSQALHLPKNIDEALENHGSENRLAYELAQRKVWLNQLGLFMKEFEQESA